ncbi:THUMP domain-containing protein [Pseudogemmatithrix spongiicola]|uniref:THUMP domain-containing protein n=1 Tax=Pseudogemmatithrix spongiicola TaxID=3062599 RepID=A0AA49JXI5_9BACT|nr:THUMP domain-containing protein [Gemmatimonadaceae bacterium 'strain 138']WKW13882.1 THUMP domain-containing protein [Gemmatimonadaceae bacterium 'strain 318']
MTYDAWAVAAPGLEPLLEAELRTLGFADAAASTGGVRFACDASGLARANLQSRLASRVVVRLATFKALAFHELERAARRVEWTRMLGPNASYRLRVTAKKSRLYHSDAIAQRVAEAIERAVPGARRVDGPAKDEDEPLDDTPHALGVAADAASAQLFVVRFEHDRCTVSADSSGALLHRRGYRQAVAKAPMRETLAAAMLSAARYDVRQPLVDPFCGSGTLLIEAAMMARRIAPGSWRSFAAERWPEVPAEAWARQRAQAAEQVLPKAPAAIIGADRDAGAVAAAIANAERAGVRADLEVLQRPLAATQLPPGPGLLITNPPYGVRVSERGPLRDLYATLGRVLREQGRGWRFAMLSADRALDGHTGLRFTERLRTSNGGIPVRVVEAQG